MNNREIKFKCLNEKISGGQKEWIYYSIMNKPHCVGGRYITPDLQYTGLKDKKGKEIYEWDVNQDGGVVIWNDDDASFLWEYKSIGEMQPMGEESDWCIIEGNIYENQELIK